MADLDPVLSLVNGIVKGKDQSRVPYTAPSPGMKPMPNIANPMAGAAFGQAPRAFNPTATAFQAK